MASDDEKQQALEAFLKDSLHAIESLEAVERLSAEEQKSSESEAGADQEALEESSEEKRRSPGRLSTPEEGDSAVMDEALPEAGFLDRLGGWTSSAFRLARKTTGGSIKVGRALMRSQDQLKLMLAAGQSLRDLREVAGLTINDLSEALNLRDRSLLEAVENGTATLSFELILRLAAVLARNDPVPFILKYTRTYNPEIWRILNDWGVGRLPLQFERERQFINIFRSHDAARKLSDEGFQRVLEFTRKSFEMSLHFVAEEEERLSEAMEKFREEQAKASETPANDKQRGRRGRKNGRNGNGKQR